MKKQWPVVGTRMDSRAHEFNDRKFIPYAWGQSGCGTGIKTEQQRLLIVQLRNVKNKIKQHVPGSTRMDLRTQDLSGRKFI